AGLVGCACRDRRGGGGEARFLSAQYCVECVVFGAGPGAGGAGERGGVRPAPLAHEGAAEGGVRKFQPHLSPRTCSGVQLMWDKKEAGSRNKSGMTGGKLPNTA